MAYAGATAVGTPKQLSASAAVKSSDGVLIGIFVSSSTAGTITIYDNTSATGSPVVAQFTGAAATYYPIPIAYSTGLYVAIGGTIQCTVIYQ